MGGGEEVREGNITVFLQSFYYGELLSLHTGTRDGLPV